MRILSPLVAALALSAATLPPAQAQVLPGLLGDTVKVSASVQTEASELHGFPVGAYICYPDTAPVPGRLCADADSASTNTPGEVISARSYIEPPQFSPPNALVEGEGTAYQSIITTSRGYLKHFEAQLAALAHIRGPNSGDMNATASAATAVDFKVLTLLNPTQARISGVLRVKATDPVNLFFTPPWEPARPVALVRLTGTNSGVVFEKTLGTTASAGQFIELSFDEPLTLANDSYQLSFSGGGRVSHLAAANTSIGPNKNSVAEVTAEVSIDLDNLLLRLLP